jgi:hypothetical protein
MTGENAALRIFAEEHIIQARRELYTAMDRLRELETNVSAVKAKRLEGIRCSIQARINNLGIDELISDLRVLV